MTNRREGNIPCDVINYFFDFLEGSLPFINGALLPRERQPSFWNNDIVMIPFSESCAAHLEVVLPSHHLSNLKMRLSAFDYYLSFTCEISQDGHFMGGIYTVKGEEEIVIYIDDKGRVYGHPDDEFNKTPYLDDVFSSMLDQHI